MPRVLCVGNGNLQVNFDNDMNIRDMYFPFVGMENYVSGHFCRFGVWVDGRFSWIDGSWNKSIFQRFRLFWWTKYQIGGKKYSLYQIENKILRKKFSEPRIHFAMNCASTAAPC